MPATEHSREPQTSHPRRRSPTTVLEWIGGGMLCLLLVATPWMYGTTLEWSIHLMNVGSFIAAGILALCAIYNFFSVKTHSTESESKWNGFWKYGFLVLNVLVFVFSAIALYNARATLSIEHQTFIYFDDYNPALPTTYDANATRQTLSNWAAAFCAFWALRYWIVNDRGSYRSSTRSRLNLRIRTLLWVLSINGFLLSIQGILQRLSGTTDLLWLRPGYSRYATASFGPFAYRGNAVEYINLLWPLALAFWWLLSRERRRAHGIRRLLTDGPELILIPASVVMLAAAFITLSRGGIVVAGAILVASVLLLLSQRLTSRTAWITSGALLFCAGALVFYLGVEKILKRFTDPSVQTLGGRIEIYENSHKIAADYPRFGVGPGAFSSVYHLYRESTKQPWHAWVHDDWLETRVTMGWVGFTIVLLNLVFLFGWILSSGRPAVPWIFTALVSLGLLGCLVKAKFDFPMQTYSIFYTFVAIAAILTSVSPARK